MKGMLVVGLAMVAALGLSGAASAQEKRAIFTEENFHWQGNLKAGQTLEVINRNGDIEASAGEAARVQGMRRDGSDEKDFFVEVVEYSDGVTICAVYAKNQAPGRCHRGGVSSDSD